MGRYKKKLLLRICKDCYGELNQKWDETIDSLIIEITYFSNLLSTLKITKLVYHLFSCRLHDPKIRNGNIMLNYDNLVCRVNLTY